MFCQKCGTKNPDNGKFCRSCGAGLGNVSEALSANRHKPQNLVDRKGRQISWESAIVKIFSGLAFLAVSIFLAFSQAGNGWWFWMLIPAFGALGSGVAQFVQLKKSEHQSVSFASQNLPDVISSAPPNAALPSSNTDYIAPDSRYQTGELVPPSVTESTTRHLEINHEGETMTLPKK